MTAAASRVPIAPLTSRYPELTLEDAYRVQEHQVRAWDRAGRHLIGFKVGLTSKAMQRMLGVASPDFGHLYQDMVLDNTAPINAERFIAPRVEPEVTFVLKDDLSGPGLTIIDAVRAVDYAIASIELIDSRIADWRIGLADTIADNASSGALLLGKVPVALDAVDLGLLGCVVTKNGEVVASGAGAAVLGHPINGLLWLANQLGRFGRTLPAGSVVMSGSITAAVPVAPGDRVTAAFAGLGTVDARVAPASHDSEENS
nr:2-keto-4-pentenoate hydratase [Microbacterium pseudoresistens]